MKEFNKKAMEEAVEEYRRLSNLSNDSSEVLVALAQSYLDGSLLPKMMSENEIEKVLLEKFNEMHIPSCKVLLAHYGNMLREKDAEIARLREALADIATGKHPQKRCVEIANTALGKGK